MTVEGGRSTPKRCRVSVLTPISPRCARFPVWSRSGNVITTHFLFIERNAYR